MVYNRLLWIILNLVCVGINILEFFLIVRAILSWKQVSLLMGFDDAGKTLVNTYTGLIDRSWSRIVQKHLTLKGNLLIGLLLLELARIIITGLAKLL